MADGSAIEWTDATWNPMTGCTKITRGCENCYAARFAERWRGIKGHPYEQGFDLRIWPERLSQPARWRKPRKIFVNSMSDMFHKNIPRQFIDKVFEQMENEDRHIYQILTKRSSLMRSYLRRRYSDSITPEHIWFGVSVEDINGKARIRHLQASPVAVRFLSIEPLLGPVGEIDLDGISWVIVGGESGPKARTLCKEWVLDIRDQCAENSVPFFFKQWGGITPKAGGRELEGVEHNAMPLTKKQRTKFMNFKWHPDENPPQIEPHSKAKLRVLRSYLSAYFDRLNVNPIRDEFKLDLIDGFAGGGSFLDNNEILYGSPLIMLEEALEAKHRLNQGRKKPLEVDCKFYFVDKEKAHTDHLKKVLNGSGFSNDKNNIVVRTGPFEDEFESILNSIKKRQPRSGRAIFLLDQTGYSQVNFSLISRIFIELPASEVILTFAVDSLVNFLSESPEMITATKPLELSEERIRSLINDRSEYGGKALIQRGLRQHIRIQTGANYDTPFFIKPEKSRRALWFVHLSQHPTARDVMIQRHWDVQNTFEHCGTGSIGMLGWDSLHEDTTKPLFLFKDLDAQQMHKELLNDLPGKLFSLVSEKPIFVETFRHLFANETAARFSDLDKIILQLQKEGEFVIQNQEGKQRSKSLKNLNKSDLISLPNTLILPMFSRVTNPKK